MNQLKPATDLKKLFKVYGHFYCNDMGTDGKFPCRSVLEIASVKLNVTMQYLSKRAADAIVIMMNPGSSSPVGLDPCIAYNKKSIVKLVPLLVDTKPDPTQYQIMRIMAIKEWKHARVINLSDLRTPQSEELFKVLRKTSSDQHSIFAEVRNAELNMMLKRKDGAPIICAWGTNNELIPLIKKAMQVLKGTRLAGFKKVGTEYFYYHPMPKNHYPNSTMSPQLQWIQEIMNSLKPSNLKNHTNTK